MNSRLGGAAVLIAMLLGPLSAARAADAATPTDPPVAGQCRTLTYAGMQGSSDTSQVVPCSQSHTAKTIAVPALPGDVDPATASTTQLDTAANKVCASAVAPYFKGTHIEKDMALWAWGYFLPDSDQLAAGDDWVECDVVVISPAKQRLMPLPNVTKPLYAGKEPKAALACHAGAKGQSVVSCAQSHQWHPVGGFMMRKGSYPTKKPFLKAGQKCHAITHTGKYLVTWPLKAAWTAGDRAVICSKPTTT